MSSKFAGKIAPFAKGLSHPLARGKTLALMVAAVIITTLGCSPSKPQGPPTTQPPTTPAPNSCTFGQFKAGNWPCAAWRPYDASSPFNTVVPAPPKLLPNSTQIVKRVFEPNQSVQDRIPVGAPRPSHLEASQAGSLGEPTYYLQQTDPQFRLHCKDDPAMRPNGQCPIENSIIRIPAGSRAESGPDHHITVVDQASGWEYDFWGVHELKTPASPVLQAFSSIPALGPQDIGDLYIWWGGKSKIDGNGSADDGLLQGNSCNPPIQCRGGATAARFANLGGRLRAEELRDATAREKQTHDGIIQHALFLVINCDDGTSVLPATAKGQSCQTFKPNVPNMNVNAPPMGAHFWLDRSSADISNLKIADWKKVILRTLATYGGLFGDTAKGTGYFAIEAETDDQYTSLGNYPPLWFDFAKGNFDQGAANDYVGRLYGDKTDSDPNLNWQAEVWDHMRVLDPCGGEGRPCQSIG